MGENIIKKLRKPKSRKAIETWDLRRVAVVAAVVVVGMSILEAQQR